MYFKYVLKQVNPSEGPKGLGYTHTHTPLATHNEINHHQVIDDDPERPDDRPASNWIELGPLAYHDFCRNI